MCDVKTCGNCACIEWRLENETCILDGKIIKENKACENWEPNVEIELRMLRKEITELRSKLAICEKVIPEWKDKVQKLESQAAEYRLALKQIEFLFEAAFDCATPSECIKSYCEVSKDAYCRQIAKVIIEALYSPQSQYVQKLEGTESKPLLCIYCGKRFNSIGPDNTYKHNWVRCKEETEAVLEGR